MAAPPAAPATAPRPPAPLMAAPAEPARLKPVGSVRPSAPGAISASCPEDGLGDKDAPTPRMSYFRPFAVTTIVPMLVNRTAARGAGTENTGTPAASCMLNVPALSIATMTGTVLAPLIMLLRQ